MSKSLVATERALTLALGYQCREPSHYYAVSLSGNIKRLGLAYPPLAVGQPLPEVKMSSAMQG